MPSTVTDRLYGENSAVAIKAPVLGVATANVALTGLQTIGFAQNEGDRVLLIGQTDQTQNGIWNLSATAWQRAGDFDGANDVVEGTLVPVLLQPNGYAAFYQLMTASPTIGSSALTFSALASSPNFSWPQTQAEINAGVTPTNTNDASGAYRYGAAGNGATADDPAWAKLCKVNGYHFVLDGTYLFTKKVQISAYVTIEGSTRQNTEITFGNLADYVLEVGNVAGGPNVNVVALHRLRFVGGNGANTTAALHMNSLAHMAHLNELLFQGTGGPAILVTNCWDSNYTNIDILSCGNTGGNASADAGVIVTGGCNNLYFRGLRVEQCPSGCIYVGGSSGPVWVVSGKCDQGFITQYASTIYVDGGSELTLDDFSVTGTNGQYAFTVLGALSLGRVHIDGGSGKEAHIYDRRTWSQTNTITNPTYSDNSLGPGISPIDLGRARFGYSHPSVNNVTGAVMNSKQQVRILRNFQISANGAVSGNSITLGTNLATTQNDQYKNCYIVHNPTGYQAAGQPGARRRILSSFTNGNIVVEGAWGVTLDSDWGLEYCGGHSTRVDMDNIQLAQNMTPFAILQSGISISGALTYQAGSTGAQGGCTTFALSGATAFPANTDATGYYLVDEVTGEPYLIDYGVDGSSSIGIMYDYTGNSDPTRVINTSHTFSIVAGYHAGVRIIGDSYVWQFAGNQHNCPVELANAYGFDKANLPLWGLGFNRGSFTGSLTGMTAALNATFYYTREGNLVTIRKGAGAALGTSNATTMSLTGLPKQLIPTYTRTVVCGCITNGSSDYQVGTAQVNTDGSIGFAVLSGAAGNGAFNGAGNKGIDPYWEIVYSID